MATRKTKRYDEGGMAPMMMGSLPFQMPQNTGVVGPKGPGPGDFQTGGNMEKRLPQLPGNAGGPMPQLPGPGDFQTGGNMEKPMPPQMPTRMPPQMPGPPSAQMPPPGPPPGPPPTQMPPQMPGPMRGQMPMPGPMRGRGRQIGRPMGAGMPMMAKGGSVSKASNRADGIAQRGKTRGKMC